MIRKQSGLQQEMCSKLRILQQSTQTINPQKNYQMNQKPDNFKSITLTWQNLKVNVADKILLNDVSGYCRPGEMLAIMGPSGAGKTTLLSLLAAKKNEQLKIEGKVLANKRPFAAEDFYNFGVYIYQNDILHQTLTVKQTLQFIAKLRIPNDIQSQKRVKTMISLFQLQKCQDTYVGGQFKKGVSGGEKKRVCIAVQMISNPSLLILDEPTSGLDSNKAKSVVKILKRLSLEQNKTIIFTLHQPSFSIYQQLDRLVLLDKGKTIYQGKSSQIYDYMTNQLSITVPLDCTISDFFMLEISEYKAAKFNHTTSFNEKNYNLKLKDASNKQVQLASKSIQNIGFQSLKTVRSVFFMFAMLIGREWIIFKRNPMKGARVVMNSMLMILTIGVIFLDGVSDGRPTQGQTLYDNRQLEIYFIKVQGVTFIAIVSCIMTGIFSVSLTFPNDREIYQKQTSSKKYRPIAYLISKIIIEAGSVIVGAILFSIGQYFIVGYQNTFEQLLKYSKNRIILVVCLVSCTLVGNSLGLLTGALFKDAKQASAMAPALLMPLMMFSGLYNKLDDIPKWISWVQYLSPFRYGLHSVLLNQFNNEKFMTEKGWYEYRYDLGINIDFLGNIMILVGLSFLYYSIAFILLKKLSSNLNL